MILTGTGTVGMNPSSGTIHAAAGGVLGIAPALLCCAGLLGTPPGGILTGGGGGAGGAPPTAPSAYNSSRFCLVARLEVIMARRSGFANREYVTLLDKNL
jgi:hypothetical protein